MFLLQAVTAYINQTAAQNTGQAPAARNHFLGMELQTWIEILTGLMIEGVLVSFIFYWIQNNSQKKTERHFEKHLNRTEMAIIDKLNIELQMMMHAETAEKIESIKTQHEEKELQQKLQELKEKMEQQGGARNGN